MVSTNTYTNVYLIQMLTASLILRYDSYQLSCVNE